MILDLILHPNHWNKLGFAVQWAKWVEWEGGIDYKSAIQSPGILYIQNPLHPFSLNVMLNQLDFSLVDMETLVGCVETGDWSCLLKEQDQGAEGAGATDPKHKEREIACRSLEDLCLFSFYLRHGLSLLPPSPLSTPVDQKEQENDRLVQNLVTRILVSEPLSRSEGVDPLIL